MDGLSTPSRSVSWAAPAGDLLLGAALVLAAGLLPPFHDGPGPLLSAALASLGLFLLLRAEGSPRLSWLALAPLPMAALPEPARAAGMWLALALARGAAPASPRLALLVRTAAAASLWALALSLPQAWFLFDFAARLPGVLLSAVSGRVVALGEGPLLHLPALFLLKALLQWGGGGGRRRLGWWGAAALAGVVLAGLSWRWSWPLPGPASWTLGAAILAWFLAADLAAGEPRTSAPARQIAPRPRWGDAVAAAAYVLPLALLALSLSPPPARMDGLRVAFREEGQWTSRLPLGEEGVSPHLGGLMAVLDAWGARVETRGDDALARDPDCDVLWVVQPERPLGDSLRRSLTRWLERGGVLIAVGEHTHVHGIGEGLGSLLRGQPLSLPDDSAIPTLAGWMWGHNLRFLASPATAGLRDSRDLGVSIGASCAVEYPAMPLVTGTLAFTDRGNPDNPRGRMGNTRPDPGERLGGVPLVAAAPVGKGLLVLMGDKSPLMSLNNPLVWPYYLNLTGRLAARSPLLESCWLRLGLLVLAAAALQVLTRSGVPWREAAAALALAASLAWVFRAPPYPAPARGGDIVWLDASHQPNWWHAPDHDWSASALVRTIMRGGGVPLAMHRLDERDLAGSRALVLAGPSRPFSGRERALLRRYVERGGRLVVAGDGRRAEAVNGLLADFGLAVGEIPLGAAPEATAGGRPSPMAFWEAWDVADRHGGADTLASCWGHALVMRRAVGKGSVTVVGDERAFSRWALEGPGRGGRWVSSASRFRLGAPARPPAAQTPAKARYVARRQGGRAVPAPARETPPPAPQESGRPWAWDLLGLTPRPEGGRP